MVRLGPKLVASGGELIKVPPKYTSQRCPECGHTNNGNRKTQATLEALIADMKITPMRLALLIYCGGRADRRKSPVGGPRPKLHRRD
jgi:hypothetical protein